MFFPVHFRCCPSVMKKQHSANSYLGSFYTPGYCSAILHLRRPMSKICLSTLFSISLAEFFSSNNLKSTLNTINKHLISEILLVCDIFSLTIYFLTNSNPFNCKCQQNSVIRTCEVVNPVKVRVNQMESRSVMEVSAAVGVAAQTASSPMPCRTCQCRRHQMAVTAG